MHYVIGDIHNDLKKLKQILKQINITRDDELIVLGDVFDRGNDCRKKWICRFFSSVMIWHWCSICATALSLCIREILWNREELNA